MGEDFQENVLLFNTFLVGRIWVFFNTMHFLQNTYVYNLAIR